MTPKPRTAGYVAPSIAEAGGIQHNSGHATGDITLKIVDELAVKDGAQYGVSFKNSPLRYSVEDSNDITATVKAVVGKTASLGYKNIKPESFNLRTASGTQLVSGTDYTLNSDLGSVVITGSGISDGDLLTATFRYFPIFESRLVANQEANPVFDGIHMFVENDLLSLDTEQTGWSS